MNFNIDKGKYYYDFCGTVKKLKQECFICGTTENIEPHHIRRAKQRQEIYADEKNIVMLCRTHHKRYHNKYSNANVNPKTFAEYVKRQILKEVNEKNKIIEELKSENNDCKKENRKLKQQLDFII